MKSRRSPSEIIEKLIHDFESRKRLLAFAESCEETPEFVANAIKDSCLALRLDIVRVVNESGLVENYFFDGEKFGRRH